MQILGSVCMGTVRDLQLELNYTKNRITWTSFNRSLLYLFDISYRYEL